MVCSILTCFNVGNYYKCADQNHRSSRTSVARPGPTTTKPEKGPQSFHQKGLAAVYAEKRGWVVAVDAEFTGVELAEEDSQDEAVHLGASPPS